MGLRFLSDGMLGKLARWLRMIGCDVKYARDYEDDDLIYSAISEGRVLLTCDIDLYRRAVAKGVEACLVKGRTEAERLAKVAKRFDLKLEVDTATSRCPTCGSRIEQVEKTLVKADVPNTTFNSYNEFWMCSSPRCKKVYWQGSHWRKIDEVLSAAKKILESRGMKQSGGY